MFFPKFGTVLAFLLTASPLMAAPSVVVTPATLPGRVRSQNPDLAAARLRIQEAMGRLHQSGRLANPELDTSLDHNPAFREGKLELGISQKFPVTSRLQLEKEISTVELQAAKAEVANFERQLIGNAGSSLVEILALREQRELLRKQSDLTRQLAEGLNAAAAKGEGSLLEAGEAKIVALQATTEIRQLDARETSLIGTIKPLLGMAPEEGLVVSGRLPDAVLPATDKDVSSRPDYATALLEADAASRSVSLQQAKRHEDVEGGIFVSADRTEDAPDGLKNETMIGLRFRIALPFWNRNEGAIEEARATHQRKQLETTALARTIRLEADTARNEMIQWKKLIDEISDQLLPLAIRQSEESEMAWHNGQADLQAVLRSREQRLKLASSRLDALREFHLARIRHQTATGKF